MKATRDRQPNRCDMALIERELTKLYHLENKINNFDTAVVLMEEIVARSNHGYSWDSDRNHAIMATTKGLEIVLDSNEADGSILGSFRWTQEQVQKYNTVRKYLPKRADAIKGILEEGGWNTKKESQESYSLWFSFHTYLPITEKRLDSLAKSLSLSISEISKIA
jgi:hypothetical protein